MCLWRAGGRATRRWKRRRRGVRWLQRCRSPQRSTWRSMTQSFSTTPTGLVARLLPCDIVARVSPMGWFSAAREVELARRLADETDAPVAGLDPTRRATRLYERDGFEIAMWTYFEPARSEELPPADYADALERLHGALRQVDVSAPHFTDRLAEIRQWLADPRRHAGAHRRGPRAPRRPVSRPGAVVPRRRRRRAAAARRAAPVERARHEERAALHRLRELCPRAGRVRPCVGARTRSASAIGTLTRSWSASAGASCWRSSQRTAGVETTSTRAAGKSGVAFLNARARRPAVAGDRRRHLVAPSQLDREPRSRTEATTSVSPKGRSRALAIVSKAGRASAPGTRHNCRTVATKPRPKASHVGGTFPRWT